MALLTPKWLFFDLEHGDDDDDDDDDDDNDDDGDDEHDDQDDNQKSIIASFRQTYVVLIFALANIW